MENRSEASSKYVKPAKRLTDTGEYDPYRGNGPQWVKNQNFIFPQGINKGFVKYEDQTFNAELDLTKKARQLIEESLDLCQEEYV